MAFPERTVGEGTTGSPRDRSVVARSNQTARGLNILLGIWLFISAFAWPHTRAQFANTWIVAVVVVAFAIIALGVREVRMLNTLVAIWLFISAFALRGPSRATVWNNALVAVAILIVSLVPTMAAGGIGRPRTPHPA